MEDTQSEDIFLCVPQCIPLLSASKEKERNGQDDETSTTATTSTSPWGTISSNRTENQAHAIIAGPMKRKKGLSDGTEEIKD